MAMDKSGLLSSGELDESLGTLPSAANTPSPSTSSNEETDISDEDSHYPVFPRLYHDVVIPAEFELRGSKVCGGPGIWTRISLPIGQTIGPFTGLYRTEIQNTHQAWKLLDQQGKERGWIDASLPGSGNWMKFVRKTQTTGQENLMAVQVQDQIYYKAVRDIEAGEEMLLYSKESTYSDQDSEKMHINHNNEEEDKKYPCEECGEVFRSKVALRRHETYACKNENAIFTKLNQDFKDKSHHEELGNSQPSDSMLDESSEEHRSESPCNPSQFFINHDGQFPCENCERVFSDPSNLQRHIRSNHLGARSHACPECGKTFATSSGLKQHRHIHSSVKPFQCEVCHKAYTQFSNLCRHKRLHADCRQQIKCTDCGQTFSTMTSLSKHKRFCEGLGGRQTATFPYLTQAAPKSAASVATTPPSSVTPGFMNYLARPPFPFYPPLGPYPGMLHPSHPLAALTPPFSPGAKFPSVGPFPKNFGNSTSPDNTERSISPIPKAGQRLQFDGSECSESSEISSLDDMESNIQSDIDSHNASESSDKPSPRPTHILPVTPVKTPVPQDTKPCNLSVKKEVPQSEEPFDLSKSSIKSEVSNPDQPLDLSKKSPVMPTIETPRKTHIFGNTNPPSSEKKPVLSCPVPMMSPTMPLTREKMSHNLHNAASMGHMMPFRPPFPMPMYPHMMANMGLVRPEPQRIPAMQPYPLKTADAFTYSPGGNKVKDRYACKFCGKIFPRSANLTRHLRTHTGEQPYKCKYCERSFSISSNLQRHVRNIHNKEKPYKCSICDRCFGQQTNLDRHLKKHEAEGPEVTDSPPRCDADIDDKEESYFEQIRNFIGDETPQKDSPRSDSSSLSNDSIDDNFSVTSPEARKIMSSSPIEADKMYEKHILNNNRLDGMNGEFEKCLPLTNGFHSRDDDEPPRKKPCPLTTPLVIAT